MLNQYHPHHLISNHRSTITIVHLIITIDVLIITIDLIIDVAY